LQGTSSGSEGSKSGDKGAKYVILSLGTKHPNSSSASTWPPPQVPGEWSKAKHQAAERLQIRHFCYFELSTASDVIVLLPHPGRIRKQKLNSPKENCRTTDRTGKSPGGIIKQPVVLVDRHLSDSPGRHHESHRSTAVQNKPRVPQTGASAPQTPQSLGGSPQTNRTAGLPPPSHGSGGGGSTHKGQWGGGPLAWA
jgi:hypothetical protein